MEPQTNYSQQPKSNAATQNFFFPIACSQNLFTTDNRPCIQDADIKITSSAPTKPDKDIKNVWTKEKFDNKKNKNNKRSNLTLDLNSTWATEVIMQPNDETEDPIEVKELFSPTPSTPETDKEIVSPSHHARRPMNAFLIFCKKHRPIVRQKFPNLENRGVTRILGEWWALLDTSDKNCYTNLAKEYKDAFFFANPGFKWYKLPAPPLRTLNTRPANVQKILSPLLSPSQTAISTAEFTPGKLADESQLGSLTSLMNLNNLNNAKAADNGNNLDQCMAATCRADNENFNSTVNINNNIESYEKRDLKHLHVTPSNTTRNDEPPKPLKKRRLEQFNENDNKHVVRNIFDTKAEANAASIGISLEQNYSSRGEDCEENQNEPIGKNGFTQTKPNNDNMTQQELLNKVVESMFVNSDDTSSDTSPKPDGDTDIQKAKEPRKSGRLCKGKRYAEFMVEGKLLSNKHAKRFVVDVSNKIETELNKLDHSVHNKNETQTPTLDLENTIKRLAERTNTKLEPFEGDGKSPRKNGKRARTVSETSDDTLLKMQPYFNLDLRIAELPSLSYETFLQRKRESKKRKCIRSKSESCDTVTKAVYSCKSENGLVGSKKRKNKNNITRLEKPLDAGIVNTFNNDLFGLATLAEVAANTQKIN